MLATGAAGASAGTVVATERPLTDHGVSAVTGRDCRVTRLLRGGEYCAPTWTAIPTAEPGSPALAPASGAYTVTLTAICDRNGDGTVVCTNSTEGGAGSVRARVVRPR